jgi:energy-converting hydrogenase Eha subunit C
MNDKFLGIAMPDAWREAIILAFLLGITALGVFLFIMLLRFLDGYAATHWARVLIGLIVVMVGFAAYVLRRENQKLYGIMVLNFGIVLTIYAVSYLTFTTIAPLQVISLIGCTYVIATGLNNIGKANRRRRSYE